MIIPTLSDVSIFNKSVDRMQQGFVNFHYLGRAMIRPDGFNSNDAFKVDADASGTLDSDEAVIDPSNLYFEGISQGGIMGGALTAMSPDFRRSILNVPAINYSTLLRRSVDSDEYFKLENLGLYDNYPNELERPLLLSTMQLLWDRGEGNGYAHHMTDDPLPNTPDHDVLLQLAYGDHQVSNVAAEVEARTIGASVHNPALDPGRHWEATPFSGIPSIDFGPGADHAVHRLRARLLRRRAVLVAQLRHDAAGRPRVLQRHPGDEPLPRVEPGPDREHRRLATRRSSARTRTGIRAARSTDSATSTRSSTRTGSSCRARTRAPWCPGPVTRTAGTGPRSEAALGRRLAVRPLVAHRGVVAQVPEQVPRGSDDRCHGAQEPVHGRNSIRQSRHRLSSELGSFGPFPEPRGLYTAASMKVGVIGLGYVGLPLGLAFAEEGHDVVGLDADSRKVDALRAGESYIEDVPSASLQAVAQRLAATTHYEDLSSCDAVIICVPTPLTQSREPDLTHLVDSANSLAKVLKRGQLVSLESTTYPGTTRERLRPILEESGLAAGRDFHLAFSPERIDPGRTDYTVRTTPKVVGGLTEECTERAAELYGEICDTVVRVSGPEPAELTKLLENIFRSVNIALVNELAMLCERLEIDIWEVIDAAATKPFGFMRFDPGPGMGGHCLPVDPFYLSYKAREHDFYTEFIELAGKTNQNQPAWCVQRIERALNEVSKPVKGSKVLLLGVSYKAGVGDIRESPALKIIGLVRELSGDVCYHDPYVRQAEGAGPELGRARPGPRRLRHRLHRHRASRVRLRADRRRGAPGARLPRGHARHRGQEPRPPLAPWPPGSGTSIGADGAHRHDADAPLDCAEGGSGDPGARRRRVHHGGGRDRRGAAADGPAAPRVRAGLDPG